MKKTLLTIVLAALCLDFSNKVQAQTPNSKAIDVTSKGIQIRQKFPDAIWNKPFQVINHPKNKQTITLKDYGNKLTEENIRKVIAGQAVQFINRNGYLTQTN